ncbi:MAG: hypothetical protein ACI8PT_001383 [Gammaproteobacteria bacterium]|jgi:hypothetical protein
MLARGGAHSGGLRDWSLEGGNLRLGQGKCEASCNLAPAACPRKSYKLGHESSSEKLRAATTYHVASR